MRSPLHILYLEDDKNDVELVQTKLEAEDFTCNMIHVEAQADFVAALDKGGFDIILADYKLPSFDGLSALAIAREKTPKIPFIFLSGVMGEELAIDTLKNGATDYVLKQHLSRLGPAINRALKEAEEHLERKKAEEANEKLSRLNRLILNSAGEGILGLDLNGNHTFVNSSAAQMLGYRVKELIGKHSHQMWHHSRADGSLYPEEECPIYAACKDGIIRRIKDEVFWRKDGTSFPVAYTSTPILEGGKLTGTVITFTDITKRKREEEELRRHRQHLKELVDERTIELSMELAISLSEVFEALKKISSGDPDVIIPEESEVELISLLKHMVNITSQNIREIVDQSHEFAMVLAEHFDVLHRVSKGDLSARVSGESKVELLEALKKISNETIESIEREITERIRTEEALRESDQKLKESHDQLEMKVQERTAELVKANEELARSNADLRDFAHVASHDLKGPLHTIEGFAKLLARRYKGKLDTKAEELIEYIVDGTKRMQELIKDLLEYSQIGIKANKIAPTNFSLVVESVMSNLKAAIEENKAVLTYDELPTMIADFSQMTSLFQNLIDNAIKFRGKEAPRVHISAKREGQHLIFSIRDDGIGIDPKDSEAIFEMFQRLHSSKDYHGTGIGLATCKKIVESCGGRIWVESEPGGGATFYFSIPERQPSLPKEKE